MHFVAIKEIGQQDIQSIHRMRSLAVGQLRRVVHSADQPDSRIASGVRHQDSGRQGQLAQASWTMQITA